MNGSACCSPARAGTPVTETGDFSRTAAGDTTGMRLLQGGEYLMGNERDYGFAADGEGPVHKVELAPFWIDACAVSNEQFNDFVNATKYKTDSEKFGWSYVFAGHLTPRQLQNTVRLRVQGSEWWCRVPAASWRHPEGAGSNIKQRWKHPAVHISWTDALAYCAWIGKRLPTEAEWEFAARGGLGAGNRFPWGDELEPAKRHRMNVWQGIFPTRNDEADGFFGTCPVQTYSPNGYGLYCMTGNVWEWCWDWYEPAYYRVSPVGNPVGPLLGDRRVMRGGSYLCHESYCNRYRVDARSGNSPDSAATNVGFRCVRDI